jgi:hypothetical protein
MKKLYVKLFFVIIDFYINSDEIIKKNYFIKLSSLIIVRFPTNNEYMQVIRRQP